MVASPKQAKKRYKTSLIIIPNVKPIQLFEPDTKAREIIAKTPGPGVMLKISIAIKNESAVSNVIDST